MYNLLLPEESQGVEDRTFLLSFIFEYRLSIHVTYIIKMYMV